MHMKLTELPPWSEEQPGYGSIVWGGWQMGYVDLPMPFDATPMYADLPGSGCPCPHWMYIFEGTITARYPSGEHETETARAGEVCYFPPGHILIYEEPTKALEFNPPEQLDQIMAESMKKLAELGLEAFTS